MSDVIEYSEALKEERGGLVPGRLKLTGNQIVFKNNKTGKIDNIGSGELKSIVWQRMASDYSLRILLKNGQMYRYGGLRESEKDKLERYVNNNYPLELQTQQLSLRGWNWGTANFDGSVLNFDIKKGEKSFEIPLSNVSHCTTAKNEVTLEFHPNDDVPASLMEVRFHIPTIDGNDASQSFMEQVVSKASIIRETGECIAIFKELQCLTPRGRYDIKIYPTYIQLHGKTFDYKIPITSILRLFQLPHKDSRQIFFVTSMDPPMKQGQTRYHFLILLFSKEDESTTVELGMTDEELNEKFEGKLSKRMSGQVYEIVSRVMRALVGRKVITPDSSFAKDIPAITCSYKASNGMLYPLERGFIYLHKPPLHVRFDEINCVNFARSGGGTRSFDFEIETKSGITHSFSSIDKDEYAKLFDFVQGKKIRLKNIKAGAGKATVNDDDLIDSDLDDDQDAYMHRVKEEGRIRDEIDDSDDESSDDDFNPEGEEEDVREEFDSDASTSSSEDDEAGSGNEDKHKKKKKKLSKHHHKEKKHESSKSNKKTKSKDGGDKPKRPQSAYFLWMNSERENIKKDNPGASVAEIAKKAGEIWKTMSDSQKSKWTELANKNREEFKKSGGGGEKAASSSKKSPTKSGGGSQQFLSKEYIDSSGDSDQSDNSAKKNKKRKKDASEPAKGKKSKKDDSSEEEEESMSESDSASD